LRSICHNFESAIKEDAPDSELEALYQAFMDEVEVIKRWAIESDWLKQES
jgi:hypothetical protein